MGRINHCAGCTIGGGLAARRPSINCQSFTTLLWRLNVGLNVTATIKKSRQLFWGTKPPLENSEKLATRMRKGPPPSVGMGPRMVNPALQKITEDTGKRRSFFSKICLRFFEATCNVHRLLGVDELVLMRRHKSLERMAHEHELEVRAKDSLLGSGRQSVEQVHVTVDSCGMNVDVRRGAVRLWQHAFPVCTRRLAYNHHTSHRLRSRISE